MRILLYNEMLNRDNAKINQRGKKYRRSIYRYLRL